MANFPDPVISRQLQCGQWKLDVDARVKIKDSEFCFTEFGAVLELSLKGERWLGSKSQHVSFSMREMVLC